MQTILVEVSVKESQADTFHATYSTGSLSESDPLVDESLILMPLRTTSMLLEVSVNETHSLTRESWADD